MMIKHLIKLDFYAMKPLKKVILPFLLVPIVLGVVADLGMSIMVTLTFMVFMLNIVFAITENSFSQKFFSQRGGAPKGAPSLRWGAENMAQRKWHEQ